MEELPNNLKEIFDSRFGSMNQFTCAICGTENINSVRLASHTKDCLNYFLIYSGNGPLNASSPKQDSQKKRKLNSAELEIVFPQQQSYYNNSPKQTKNFPTLFHFVPFCSRRKHLVFFCWNLREIFI